MTIKYDSYPNDEDYKNPERFEGISYFEKFDNEVVQAIESGEVGKDGWTREEYYPRTAQYRFLRRENGRLNKWEYSVRDGSVWAPTGSPKEEDIALVNSEVNFLANNGVFCPIPDKYGYPEVDSILFRAYSQRPIQPEQMVPGRFYLSVGEMDVHAFQFKTVEINDGWGGYGIIYRVLGERSEVLNNMPGVELSGWKIKNKPRYKTIEENEYIDCKVVDPDTGESEKDLFCYEITEDDAREIASLLPVKYDPLIGSEMTREQFCIYVAMEGLQYTRWGTYEAHGRFRNSGDINFENYSKALDTIIARFGEVEFGKEIERMMMRHLKSLHTQLHLPGSPYKPHSDIGPLGHEFMKVSRDVINGIHPLTDDMTESGHVVNVLSIFGDADFWKHMGETYPGLFNQFVNYINGLPKEFLQHGIYATAVVDPIGLIQKYFPDAYQEIAVYRSDFYSDTQEPIKIVDDKRRHG